MEDVLDQLGRVIHEQRASLTRVARREGLGAEDAVDVVHDAFCTFLRLALGGERIESPPSYLAEIVRNAARNKRRLHHLARPHDAIDAVPLLDEDSAETLVAEAEEHVRLRACVDRLCETQKAVVTLRLLEERGGEDVAEALGISRGHVDVLLHRAKASLRVCMSGDVTAG
jgi:RNA polymerase sigma-70 factor (ECF subfamily)